MLQREPTCQPGVDIIEDVREIQPLPTEVLEEFFGNSRVRPEPGQLASLIERGLSEDTLLDSGLFSDDQVASLDDVLFDLETILPYIHLLSDKLADDFPGGLLLFAGRDAESMYDDFKITHADREGLLLPASSDIWPFLAGNPEIAKIFLESFGITESVLGDPNQDIVLVDTGFAGTIGFELTALIEKLHGDVLAKPVKVKLVCTKPTIPTQEDLDFYLMKPPEVSQIIEFAGEEQVVELKRRKSPTGAMKAMNTFNLAVGMQIMPRYHGAFGLVELTSGGEPVALPNPQYDFAEIDDVSKELRSANASVVAPGAAAVTQHRVVSRAMERRG